MAKKTQATSESGTTYTTKGNSKFYWENGDDSGMIDTITPGNSYYNLYMGDGNFPERVPFSQDSYNAHLNNIRGLEFKEPKSWWEETKEIGRIIKQSIWDKFKTKKQNGGTLTTLQKDTLLRHISGF
jgi:hypothetical protein